MMVTNNTKSSPSNQAQAFILLCEVAQKNRTNKDKLRDMKLKAKLLRFFDMEPDIGSDEALHLIHEFESAYGTQDTLTLSKL